MATLGIGGALPTLKNPLETMKQNELKSLMSEMMATVSRTKTPYHQNRKPGWWPDDLPLTSAAVDPRDAHSKQNTSWNDVLKNLVRSCYTYYGQQHLLSGYEPEKDAIKVVNNQDGSVSFITNQTVVTLEDRKNTPYATCPTVEAATPGKSQSAYTGADQPLPTGLFRSAANTSPVKPVKDTATETMPMSLFRSTSSHSPAKQSESIAEPANTDEKPFIEVFMCFFCEEEFHQRIFLQQHQKECSNRPRELKLRSESRRLRLRSHRTLVNDVVKVIPRPPRKLIEQKVKYPPKATYIELLGLLPQAKAESVRRQSHGNKVIDCEVIEVEKKPKTPSTPRTPKSIMSQLSRDMSPQGKVRLLQPEKDKEEEEIIDISDDDSESDKSESGGVAYRPVRRVGTLLHIDVCSPLGNRVQKIISEYFMNLENNQSPSESSSDKPYEDFCRTPTKSKVIERLRSRGKDNFQVTFRKTKRTAPLHSHLYKFRRSERNEYCRIVETGLNRRSRALKRIVKKRTCKVLLRRMSQEEITQWTMCRTHRPSSHLSPFKHAEITRWMNMGRTSVIPPTDYSVFPPQTAAYASLHNPITINGIDANTLRQLQLSSLLPPNISAELLQQRMMLYRTLLAGPAPTAMADSSANLTPPSTPEGPSSSVDDDVICLDDPSSFGQSSVPMPLSGKQTKNISKICQQQREKEIRKQLIKDVEDDIISISSTESGAEMKIVSPESMKRPMSFSPSGLDQPAKKRKMQAAQSAALLFRCHLCLEEITCTENANIYIKGHFAEAHNVYNIDLIEHLDASGNKVVSIVEVPSPVKSGLPPSLIPEVCGKKSHSSSPSTKNKSQTSARTKQPAKTAQKVSNVVKKTTSGKKASLTTAASKVKAKAKTSLVSKAKTKTLTTKNKVKLNKSKENTQKDRSVSKSQSKTSTAVGKVSRKLFADNNNKKVVSLKKSKTQTTGKNSTKVKTVITSKVKKTVSTSKAKMATTAKPKSHK